jgi:hypothetical protein
MATLEQEPQREDGLMARRSLEELKATYNDPEWRKTFCDFCDLMSILGDCIIADDYVASDALNSSLTFTEAGKKMIDRLVRKEGVSVKDARLNCALTLGHADLFIDVTRTEIPKLADAIHSELQQGRISLPFTFGRELYDRYALLFEDEKDSLSTQDTFRLLEGLPIGVYQYGRFTTGPFGLREATTSRNITSTRTAPAYHCSSSLCHRVHHVRLQTSMTASVNASRSTLDRILQDSPEESDEWWDLAAEISGLKGAYYSDRASATVIGLVGDCLSDDELRSLAEHLFDQTGGKLRAEVASFLPVRNAAECLSTLNRAQILQVLLFAPGATISSGIDHLVRSQAIVVPSGEIRRPVVNGGIESGAFYLRPELGSLGVRFVSSDPGLPLLRERRLLDKLYLRDENQELQSDVHELEWQLRGVDIEDLDERLEYFYQTTSPHQALERLVLARRTNMITACTEVGLDEWENLDDAALIDTVLWKMGFDIVEDQDPHSTFWSRHERLWALIQSSSIGGSERFLESASPYFTELEGVLLDALAFTSWALLTDHIGNDDGFSYDDEEDRTEGLKMLQDAHDAHSKSEKAVAYSSQKVDLYDLIVGFRTLAKRLRAIEAAQDEFARPMAELPDYHRKTELKTFVFQSTVPFIDLSKPSRDRITTGLSSITTTLLDAEVNAVRNDYAHYRRTTPDLEKMELALEAARQAVTKIETLGFCRMIFTRSSVSTNRWGQTRYEFSGPRSFDHIFIRPTRFDWMGLPALSQPQYLLRAASFGDQREVLRFVPRSRSAFSRFWEGVPQRRRRGPGSSASSDLPQRTPDSPVPVAD